MPGLHRTIPIRVNVLASIVNPVSQVGYHTELRDIGFSYKTTRARTLAVVSDGGDQYPEPKVSSLVVPRMKELTSRDNLQNN